MKYWFACGYCCFLDWLWAPYFLNYFESELFCQDEPFIKNDSFVETRTKCYIFKIGEQPFKYTPLFLTPSAREELRWRNTNNTCSVPIGWFYLAERAAQFLDIGGNRVIFTKGDRQVEHGCSINVFTQSVRSYIFDWNINILILTVLSNDQ